MKKLSGKRRLAMLSYVLRQVLGRNPESVPAAFNGNALAPVNGRLEFVRDQNGVAHLYADHEPDLFLAVGYLQGRERFVLLDMLRHLGQGRLSQLLLDFRFPRDVDWFGGIQLSDLDAFVLPLGFAQEAKRDLYRMPPTLQQNIKSFSRGINAALNEMKGAYPPEFLFLGEVAPWQPEDCLLLARTCGFVIGLLPLENELTFDNVRAQEGDGIARLLYPDAPWHEAPDVSAGGGEPFPDGPVDPPNMGSNNWAISGERSESGAPIVCNDPHVPLIPGPTYWHHVHLQCGEMNVQGGLFPGFPAFGYGHNESTAWGVTTAFRDSWDLFRIHRVRSSEPAYKVPGGTAPIKSHKAQLNRRFRDPVAISWESCDHGVIYPDWQHDDGTALALKYAGCNLAGFFEGHRALMRSRTTGDVRQALQKINEGPFDFNMVYGHKDGDIAWEQVGLLPRRQDNGLFVKDAHAPEAGWQGYLPFSDNPRIINPEEGLVVSANSITCEEQFSKLSTPVHCEVTYRQDRIKKLIRQTPKHTWKSLAAIQADVQADFALPLRDTLVKHLNADQQPESQFRSAYQELAAWDGSFAIDRIGATVFYFTRMQLAKEVFGAMLGQGSAQRFVHGQRALPRLDRLLRDPGDPILYWIDENRDKSFTDFIRTAFERALQLITKSLGEDIHGWQWGKLHRVKIGSLMAELPGVGKPWVALERPWPGEINTVSPTVTVSVGKRLRSVVGASSRFICDLSNPREAWFAHSSGPSCQPGSPFMHKLSEQWADYQYFKCGLWAASEIEKPVERVVMDPQMDPVEE